MTTQILPDCRIAFASTSDERERIFRFRYRIYVQEMGKQPSYADHVNSRLCDDMDQNNGRRYMRSIGFPATRPKP